MPAATHSPGTGAAAPTPVTTATPTAASHGRHHATEQPARVAREPRRVRRAAADPRRYAVAWPAVTTGTAHSVRGTSESAVEEVEQCRRGIQRGTHVRDEDHRNDQRGQRAEDPEPPQY